MKFEYEEFDTIEDVFMYMASVAPPMKNTIPINSYKEYVFVFIPVTPLAGETCVMIYSKGSLEPGIYEFDVTSHSYNKVNSIERADKIYFISLTPKRNTMADAAIKSL